MNAVYTFPIHINKSFPSQLSLYIAETSLAKVSCDLCNANGTQWMLPNTHHSITFQQHWETLITSLLYTFFFFVLALWHTFSWVLFMPLESPFYPLLLCPLWGFKLRALFQSLYILSLSNHINFCGFKYDIYATPYILYTILLMPYAGVGKGKFTVVSETQSLFLHLFGYRINRQLETLNCV